MDNLPHLRQETLINAKDLQITVIQKAGTLIKPCKPSIMGNTIAAVFCAYRLSLSKDFFLCGCCLPCSCNCLSLFLILSLSGGFGGLPLFLDLSLPLGKTVVVLFCNSFGFSAGRHKRLYIGITVLFERIGQFIQSFGYFLLRLLYLFSKSFSLLAVENALCFGKLFFCTPFFPSNAFTQYYDTPDSSISILGTSQSISIHAPVGSIVIGVL